uniref:PH domain-containing protein n=1 Tax=Steinernema glaseri TaxID=37863 RepID=A0A1I7Y4W6_9BILA
MMNRNTKHRRLTDLKVCVSCHFAMLAYLKQHNGPDEYKQRRKYWSLVLRDPERFKVSTKRRLCALECFFFFTFFSTSTS